MSSVAGRGRSAAARWSCRASRPRPAPGRLGRAANSVACCGRGIEHVRAGVARRAQLGRRIARQAVGVGRCRRSAGAAAPSASSRAGPAATTATPATVVPQRRTAAASESRPPLSGRRTYNGRAWARWSSSTPQRRSAARAAPRRSSATTASPPALARRRSCSAAAASPAASTRSARCARSTCCRSTARSTSSTSTSARAPARSSPRWRANGVTPEEMMRVVNQQVPTAVQRHRPRHAAAPQPARVRAQGRCGCRCRAVGLARHARRPARRRSRLMDVVLGPRRGAAVGPLLGRGHRALPARGALRPRPHRRLPPARVRALPDRHRPRHLRAGRVRRRGLGRRADLHRRARVDARCRWSTSRSRSSDRELIDGGIVSTTNLDIAVEAGAKFVVVINPLVPFVNDFAEAHPDAARLARAARVATWASRRSATRRSSCSPTSACTSSRKQLGGALPGRRHRADRARAERRADVPDDRS